MQECLDPCREGYVEKTFQQVKSVRNESLEAGGGVYGACNGAVRRPGMEQLRSNPGFRR
jgi:hypothetical protein